MSHAGCGPSYAANVASAAARRVGLRCQLEVRTSSGLVVKEAFGAALPLCAAGRPTDEWRVTAGAPGDCCCLLLLLSPLPPLYYDCTHRWGPELRRACCPHYLPSAGPGAEPPPTWLNKRTWHYLTPEPAASGGVTLFLDCDRVPAQAFMYLQVVLTWEGGGGGTTHRVVTRRLTTTQNPAAVVEATRPGVAALLWAKQLAVRALRSGTAGSRRDALILQRAIGQQLSEFAALYGTPDDTSRGWFGGHSR